MQLCLFSGVGVCLFTYCHVQLRRQRFSVHLTTYPVAVRYIII